MTQREVGTNPQRAIVRGNRRLKLIYTTRGSDYYLRFGEQLEIPS